MAMVPNVAPRERVFRPLLRAVRRAAHTGTTCPACSSADVRRSLRRSFFDVALASFFLVPFRCRACRARFFRVWRPAFKIPAESPRAPVLIMPRPLLEIYPVAEPPRVQPLPFTRPRSILILESDPFVRKLLCRLLHRRGYFTHEVVDADDLGAELRERRVDLLIIEASLASSSGLDATLAFARLHPSLKILALSAEPLNGAEISGRCLALAKPFASQMFLECVDRLLESETQPDRGIAL
jgi:CheY-like chemotaxis protein